MRALEEPVRMRGERGRKEVYTRDRRVGKRVTRRIAVVGEKPTACDW
jgi:hypothetical protein